MEKKEYLIKEFKNGEKVTVSDVQAVLLEMMKDIDKICRENNIEYCLTGGTALGAIRHSGFIPWDDDIDIAVSRSEYEKLVTVLEEKLPEQYTFHCYEKNKKYNIAWPAMKIRNKNTYIKEVNVLLPNKCKDSDGVFIDVFIFDKMSNNLILDLPLRLINMGLVSIIIFFENLNINPIPLKEWVRGNSKLYGKLCRRSKYIGNDIAYIFTNPTKPFKYPESKVFPVKYIDFEDTKFPVPNDPHNHSLLRYGPSYMTPPPENKRYAKHTLDINLDSSEPKE